MSEITPEQHPDKTYRYVYSEPYPSGLMSYVV